MDTYFGGKKTKNCVNNASISLSFPLKVVYLQRGQRIIADMSWGRSQDSGMEKSPFLVWLQRHIARDLFAMCNNRIHGRVMSVFMPFLVHQCRSFYRDDQYPQSVKVRCQHSGFSLLILRFIYKILCFPLFGRGKIAFSCTLQKVRILWKWMKAPQRWKRKINVNFDSLGLVVT